MPPTKKFLLIQSRDLDCVKLVSRAGKQVDERTGRKRFAHGSLLNGVSVPYVFQVIDQGNTFVKLTLSSSEHKDLAQIVDSELGLLLGIPSTQLRYEIYQDKERWRKLRGLQKFDYIEVQFSKTEVFGGVIKCIATLGNDKALKFGIELTRNRGGKTSDGVHSGYKYFECYNNRGVFVDASKLRVDVEAPVPRTLNVGDRVAWCEESTNKGTMKGAVTDLHFRAEEKEWVADVRSDTSMELDNGTFGRDISSHLMFLSELMKEENAQPIDEPAAAQQSAGGVKVKNLASSHIPEEEEDRAAHGQKAAAREQQKLMDKIKAANKRDEPQQKGGQRHELSGQGPPAGHITPIVQQPKSDNFLKHVSPNNGGYPPPHGASYEGLHPSRYNRIRELLDDPEQRPDEPYLKSSEEQNLYGFTMDSWCRVVIDKEDCYGSVKYIGSLPGYHPRQLFAGLELVDLVPYGYCTDGRFGNDDRFQCAPGKGTFVGLDLLRPDDRMSEDLSPQSLFYGSKESPEVEEPQIPPTLTSDVDDLVGRSMGIQGHHNSCYMDATLFAMFFGTCVFDTMLEREPSNTECKKLQHILKAKIVYPLRKGLYVKGDGVMALRQQLEKLIAVHGLTHAEKDPEEFLTGLAEILRFEPLTSLSSGESTLLYQLICERKEGRTAATVQELFEQSFATSGVLMTKKPTCLVLQMPRFGKDFKLYDRVVPSLELDVAQQLQGTGNSPCLNCDDPARFKCLICEDEKKDPYLCTGCMQHHQKKHSSFEPLKREVLQLMGVVCIATSHYVSYVRCGTQPDAPWLFFDSMADRRGQHDGYNIPEIRRCPRSLHEWMDNKKRDEIEKMDVHNMQELERRLIHDGYLCIYEHTTLSKY